MRAESWRFHAFTIIGANPHGCTSLRLIFDDNRCHEMSNKQFTFAVGQIKWLKIKNRSGAKSSAEELVHVQDLLHRGTWGYLVKLLRQRRKLSYCE